MFQTYKISEKCLISLEQKMFEKICHFFQIKFEFEIILFQKKNGFLYKNKKFKKKRFQRRIFLKVLNVENFEKMFDFSNKKCSKKFAIFLFQIKFEFK